MKTLYKCPQCKVAQRDGKFCIECGSQLEFSDSKNIWKPSGVWHVTTEGDEEGRSTRDLGSHEGHIVDIAKKLSPDAFYSLHFSPAFAKEKAKIKAPLDSVNVHLAIDSGTWDLQGEARLAYYRSMLSGRNDVSVTPCNYFACVTFNFKGSPKKGK